MNRDQIGLLKSFDGLYHESMAQLPVGWIGPVVDLLQTMRQLSLLEPARPTVETWVSLRVERTQSGAAAFASPNLPSLKWSAERAYACMEALSAFSGVVQITCEKCGHGAGPCHIGEMTFFFCEEHAAIARERLTVKVEAFEQHNRFRNEIKVLFQEHSTISLHVSDHNYDILRNALLDIKQIVEERSLIGKVYITKIMESEGQLFLSARCDHADPATRFEIQDIIKHAEWLSDQASLAAGKERSDSDA